MQSFKYIKYASDNFFSNCKFITLALLISLLQACGQDVQLDERKIPATINVMGVDGPMAYATINLYKLQDYLDNYNPTTNVRSTSGLTAVATGVSDGFGMLENLPMDFDSGNGPFLIEVTSNPSTIDLTTGDYPVIDTVRSIITEDQYGGDKQRFYATSLTTLVVDKLTTKDLTTDKIDNDGNIIQEQSVNDVLRNLANVSKEVVSLYGFGLLDEYDDNGFIISTIDIFDTPPVFDESTSTTDAQDTAAAYRSALETFSQLVEEVKKYGQGINNAFLQTHEDALTELKDRLSQGLSGPDFVSVLINNLMHDSPNNLERLNGVSIQALMNGELGSIATLIDNVEPLYGNIDSDYDDVPDNRDIFKYDPSEYIDSDGDGVGDNGDEIPDNACHVVDSDGDGYGDDYLVDNPNCIKPRQDQSAFINDPSEYVDTDGDALETMPMLLMTTFWLLTLTVMALIVAVCLVSIKIIVQMTRTLIKQMLMVMAEVFRVTSKMTMFYCSLILTGME